MPKLSSGEKRTKIEKLFPRTEEKYMYHIVFAKSLSGDVQNRLRPNCSKLIFERKQKKYAIGYIMKLKISEVLNASGLPGSIASETGHL